MDTFDEPATPAVTAASGNVDGHNSSNNPFQTAAEQLFDKFTDVKTGVIKSAVTEFDEKPAVLESSNLLTLEYILYYDDSFSILC